MADNILLNLGVGGDSIAADDISGIKHELVKVEFGSDGVATMVDAANPLPVTDAASLVGLAAILAKLIAAPATETTLASILTQLNGNIAVTGTFFQATPTAIINGRTTVTTAGTRVQLPTNTARSLVAKALATNTGIIYIGNATVAAANGYELAAGDSIAFDISNSDLIWIDSSVSAESVSWFLVN